ncbi:MAG: DinB family protein [Bryobacteraceae bacterium]
MTLGANLLPEFDREMAITRRVLERVPEDRFGWKPHEKSASLGSLANHVARLPTIATRALGSESFDFAPGGERLKMQEAVTRQELLGIFDTSVAEARTAIAGASDEHLKKTWTLLAAGQTIFSLPRIEVLRGSMLNHQIHHRAQLGVYLRLNDVPVPSIYGPSADEPGT